MKQENPWIAGVVSKEKKENRMAKNVLLVDDSSTMRKIISRSLRQAGLDFGEIYEAGDGLEALALLESESVDIVLSDINMPNMNGIEFLREKANRPAIKDIPVFMISTETGDDIIGEAKSLGAIGALKKPFTPEKVNEVLGPLI
ncbi:MAG: response regulator [Desulfobulbus sp.]|nr:response regulator [Desulfobulbus sp.]MDR2550778.1 response regulator [Desulfobulbus sp.]